MASRPVTTQKAGLIMLIRRPVVILVTLTTVTLAVYLTLALILPLSIQADAANGFEVWRSMQHGHPK